MGNTEKEKLIQEAKLKVAKELEQFKGLGEATEAIAPSLDQKMSDNIKLLLQEIKNISLISVTAAPFSLNVLLTNLNIHTNLLIASFIAFMLNVLILNISIWHINNEVLKSTATQKKANIFMGIAAGSVTNELLENDKRVNALYNFYASENILNDEKNKEPYKYIGMVETARFIGVVLLSLAIILLINSIVLPIFTKG